MLTVPALLGSTLAGQIVLADKEGGFTRRDIEMVTRLASYYSLALQRLKQREAVMSSRDLMQSILTGIRAAIIQIDPETMTVETINDVALRLLGGPKEAYEGKPCRAFCHLGGEERDSGNCPAFHAPVIDKEMHLTRYAGT